MGYKLSLTNPGDQARVGVDEPTFGTLTNQHLVMNGSLIPACLANDPLLEPEIMVRTKCELPLNADRQFIASNVEIAAGFEIPISRFAGWWPRGQSLRLTASSLVADNSVAGFVVTGETWISPVYESIDEIAVRVEGPNGDVAMGAASAVMGSPLNAVMWLIQRLAEQGEELPSGTLISSGTLTTPIRPSLGKYVAHFSGGLRDAEVVFTCN